MMTQKETSGFVQIRKRDGSIVPRDIGKISKAIHKSMLATKTGSLEDAEKVANLVASELSEIYTGEDIPSVETIQNTVEKQLMSNYPEAAKSYILYRKDRNDKRERQFIVPEHVKELVSESEKHFEGNKFGELVYLRTYSRWMPNENRRETWIETVQRYVDFMKENLGDKLDSDEYTEIYEAILNHEAMPSMRLLQFAGEAARRCNTVLYNCAFTAPETIKDFADTVYLSMSGCGIGFSVENYHIQKLPIIEYQTGHPPQIHTIQDSKEGWADALKVGMEAWYSGEDIEFNFSLLRPAGARLKTMGGKSSGPDPLRDLLGFTRNMILNNQGSRLTSLNIHDIMCKIAEIVVTGGVRRVAMISLSDQDDLEMRDAKKGYFYYTSPHRAMANNSAVYNTKPTATAYLKEMVALIESGSGERGLFNRSNLEITLPKRRVDFLQEKYENLGGGKLGTLGMNPCGEIILQPHQFCNLSEVVARSDDTVASILKKIKIATILGTYQSTMTKFNYITDQWKTNNEEERLLGVSITGQWDSRIARQEENLKLFRDEVIRQNKIYAKRFGINPSNAVTAVKPSGNLSSVVNSSSGMHARHSEYYIRRIRMSSSDPLFNLLRDQGITYNPEVNQTVEDATTFVIDFPVKSPEGSILSRDLTALDQLEHWKKVKKNYTEHNPSVTISVDDAEWVDVIQWVYRNWEIVGGLSFLPRNDHVYKLAPFEDIDEETYEKMLLITKDIDFSKLPLYETEDHTDVKKEVACAGGACELE